MTALVVYDSAYGNTEIIARAIATALGTDTPAIRPGEADAGRVAAADLLVVGSPTQGGRPLPSLTAFIAGLGPLAGKRVAVFDTRIPGGETNFFVRALMGVIGYAAPKLGKALRAKGGTTAAAPEGFYVTGKEGPLRDGEADRAGKWAQALTR